MLIADAACWQTLESGELWGILFELVKNSLRESPMELRWPPDMRSVVRNLKRKLNRKTYMQGWLALLNLEHRTTFFECADARSLGVDGVREYGVKHLGFHGPSIAINKSIGHLPGDRAALYSHLVVLRDFLQSDDKFLLVFEDDMGLYDPNSEGIQGMFAALEELLKDLLHRQDFDWVWLSHYPLGFGGRGRVLSELITSLYGFARYLN